MALSCCLMMAKRKIKFLTDVNSAGNLDISNMFAILREECFFFLCTFFAKLLRTILFAPQPIYFHTFLNDIFLHFCRERSFFGQNQNCYNCFWQNSHFQLSRCIFEESKHFWREFFISNFLHTILAYYVSISVAFCTFSNHNVVVLNLVQCWSFLLLLILRWRPGKRPR